MGTRREPRELASLGLLRRSRQPSCSLHCGYPQQRLTKAQVGGLIHSLLSAFVIGEFGGRTRANPHFNQRPICKPGDYEDLREAAKDDATLIAFHQRCRLIESAMDDTHVHGIAYLPPGYCGSLKNAFETVLVEVASGNQNASIIKHKEMHLDFNRTFARSAELKATCQADGSLRISAPKRKYRSNNALPPISMPIAYLIMTANAFKLTTIVFAALIGVFVARLKWVLVAAATFAIAEYLALYASAIMIFGSRSTPLSNLSISALDWGSTLAAYLCWASVFFLLKQLVKWHMKPAARGLR